MKRAEAAWEKPGRRVLSREEVAGRSRKFPRRKFGGPGGTVSPPQTLGPQLHTSTIPGQGGATEAPEASKI